MSARNLPPKCPSCGATNSFAPKVQRVEQILHGKKQNYALRSHIPSAVTLQVETPVTTCKQCQFQILTEGQLDSLKTQTQQTFKSMNTATRNPAIVMAEVQEILGERLHFRNDETRLGGFLVFASKSLPTPEVSEKLEEYVKETDAIRFFPNSAKELIVEILA